MAVHFLSLFLSSLMILFDCSVLYIATRGGSIKLSTPARQSVGLGSLATRSTTRRRGQQSKRAAAAAAGNALIYFISCLPYSVTVTELEQSNTHRRVNFQVPPCIFIGNGRFVAAFDHVHVQTEAAAEKALEIGGSRGDCAEEAETHHGWRGECTAPVAVSGRCPNRCEEF